MLAAQFLFIISHAIFSLWLHATLLLHPFSNIVLHLIKKKQQTTIPAIPVISIDKLWETISQVWQYYYRVCYPEIAKQMFFEEPSYYPSCFSHHPSGYDMLVLYMF